MYDHFPYFLWYIWKCLNLPEPTPVQYDIANYLQHGPKRRIIQAFRGIGKSWITAAYVLWLLYRDPQHKVMVVSASKERADSFSIFCKRLIEEVDILNFLRPRSHQRQSNVAFDVGPAEPDHAPSVKSVGITGQLTGSRANTIIPDDIEVPGNSATEVQREKLSELVKEFDAILKPGGQICYLGTPQIAESLYRTLGERGYKTRIWPVYYLSEKDAEKYEGNLAPFHYDAVVHDTSLVGQSVEPTRFDREDLMEREASYGRSGFALQFMLDTSLNDSLRYPLKCADLICMDVPPEIAPVRIAWASGPTQEVKELPNVGLTGDRLFRPMYISEDFKEYTGSIMFIDPSGRGADETAYAVTKVLNGMIFLADWGGLSGGYDEDTLNKLAGVAKKHSVNGVMVEDNFGDGMYLKLFEPVLVKHHKCLLEGYKVTGQKELRIIDKLEPVLNQHRLIIDKRLCGLDEEAPLWSNGLYQLTHITKDRGSLKHDDRVDVLAEAVGYWTDAMSRDTEKGEALMKEKALEEELRKHQKNFMGKRFLKKKGKAFRTF